ncbi:MAG: hypothetical protein R3314_06950 [Longimicrobiales bacterium]|nr:hypothetical protein [Longimicrobiales bacterium]
MIEQHAFIRRARVLVMAAALTAVGACAGASMSSDLGPRYGLTVINEMPHPMIVSVEDGGASRILGTVGADREERFVLDSVDGTTISIVARDEDDTHSVRRTVVLRAGESVEVRIN